jgi:transposase
MAIAVMKTISDPYRTDRSKRPYKSGVKKIIGSVDKVGNHCLSVAFWFATGQHIDF